MLGMAVEPDPVDAFGQPGTQPIGAYSVSSGTPDFDGDYITPEADRELTSGTGGLY